MDDFNQILQQQEVSLAEHLKERRHKVLHKATSLLLEKHYEARNIKKRVE